MAPFQLRVRTLYPRTQPVPSTPLSIRLGPPPTSDVHPGEVRTQHVGSTRRPLSPELRTTTPPHGTPWAQRAGFTHLPGEVHLHSLGSIFILVLGHSLMSRRTHRRPPCRNVDVKVCSRQPDQPIILIGLPRRPAPDRAHQLRPPLRSASHPLCPDPYDVSHHSSEGPIPRSLNVSITPTVTPASPPA